MPKAEPFRTPHHLPTKVCPVCGKPFVWRKKWERDWASVVYCSDKCRRAGKESGRGSDARKPYHIHD